jgi:hypothetical protein
MVIDTDSAGITLVLALAICVVLCFRFSAFLVGVASMLGITDGNEGEVRLARGEEYVVIHPTDLRFNRA